MRKLTIGKLAEEAGISIQAIRFYERKGIIEPPPRNESGYRIYDEEILYRLHFIQNAKKYGFSLNGVKELIDLHNNSQMT